MLKTSNEYARVRHQSADLCKSAGPLIPFGSCPPGRPAETILKRLCAKRLADVPYLDRPVYVAWHRQTSTTQQKQRIFLKTFPITRICGPYWVWAPALSQNALAYFIITLDSSSSFPTTHLFMLTCPRNTQTKKKISKQKKGPAASPATLV